MAPSATNDAPAASGRNSPKPPPARIWNVSEPPFEGFRPIDNEGYARSRPETAIIIDNGTPQAAGAQLSQTLTCRRVIGCTRGMVFRLEAASLGTAQYGTVQGP
jgi:hypothetical protein